MKTPVATANLLRRGNGVAAAEGEVRSRDTAVHIGRDRKAAFSCADRSRGGRPVATLPASEIDAMLIKAMLAFVLILGPSSVRAMPGNVCTDISPTSPHADNPIDPHSDSASRPPIAALRIPALLREACAP